MEKQVINVPGVEGFARSWTRRDFFKALAATGVGAAIGTSLLTSEASAQNMDLDIANFALTLEFLERDFYQLALGAGVLSGPALGVVTNLRHHEQAHVDFLPTAIQGAGGTPVPKPEFTFPPEALASQAGVIQLASVLEPTGVGAYLGAGPMISDPAILESALSIYGTENDHVVAVKNLQGIVPPANNTFQSPLTMEEVLAAIAPFLGMGAMPATGGPGE